MTESPFRNDVRNFVIQNFMFGQGDHLQDSESFLESGLIDSTGVLELVGFLETTYPIKVADEDLVPANLDSIENVCRYLEKKLQGASRRAG